MDIEKLIREVRIEIDNGPIGTVFDVTGALEHSLLTVDLDEKTVIEACKQARRYNIAALCLPPYYVRTASQLLRGSGVAVCASIGVPNAVVSSEAKRADARYSLLSGANELDVCINSHAIKSGRMEEAFNDLIEIVQMAKDKAIVKAAIEMAIFKGDEVKKTLYMIKESGAAFVKIQNVLSGKAADPADIKFVKELLGNNVRIKIDGGVKTPEKAKELVSAGADRIGLTATFDIAGKIEGR